VGLKGGGGEGGGRGEVRRECSKFREEKDEIEIFVVYNQPSAAAPQPVGKLGGGRRLGRGTYSQKRQGPHDLAYPPVIRRLQMLTSASPWLLWLQGMGTRAEDVGEDAPTAGEEEAAPAPAPFVAGSGERWALVAAAASPIVSSVFLF